MKNKRIIIKVIVILTVLLFTLLVYKLLMLSRYSNERIDIDTSTIFEKKIIVSSIVPLNQNETLKVDEMSIKNYFADYENNQNNSNFKVKYDDSGKVVSFYSISLTEQYVELLKFNSFELYSDDNYNRKNSINGDVCKFLRENKIKNDIDFLKYIKNNYYFENNIFNSVRTMKNNYLVNTFVQVALPAFKEIVLIEGMIDGYIFNMQSGMKEIHILNGKKSYTIVLSGDEITNDEFIVSLLESVNF